MTREPQETIKPSKIAITSMLAEIESKHRRATRYSLLGLVVPLLIGAAMLFGTFYAVRQRLKEKAQLDVQIAEKRAEVERLTARAAELKSGYDDLGLTITKIRNQVQDAANADESVKTLENQVLTTLDASPTVAKATPSIYIHIHDEEQRKREAKAAVDALRQAGFAVRDIERVPSVVVENTEVRYFSPETRGLANKAAGVLGSLRLPNAGTKLISGVDAQPGRIEIWFAPAPRQPKTDETKGPDGKQDTVLAVIANRKTLSEAVAYAKEVSAKNLPYPVEVYRRDVSRFYITFGGYTSAAEARARAAYAKKIGLSAEAYASNAPFLGEKVWP
jgi:hypothetical protein